MMLCWPKNEHQKVANKNVNKLNTVETQTGFSLHVDFKLEAGMFPSLYLNLSAQKNVQSLNNYRILSVGSIELVGLVRIN